jgi:hypothetical protein
MASQPSIAIMQPTYLPWVGYFDMIEQVDCFVFLDSVQFNKRSWQQRNKIKSITGPIWCTVPVLTKGRSEQIICEVETDQEQRYVTKHIGSVRQNYEMAAHAVPLLTEFSDILESKHKLLVELNIELIRWICNYLGIHKEFVRSSTLNVQGNKSELLVNICKELGFSRYVSAPGSKEYIEKENLFSPNEIDLVYHSYEHPVYRQLHGCFESHMSVLDLLLNEGVNSMSIIRSGRLE